MSDEITNTTKPDPTQAIVVQRQQTADELAWALEQRKATALASSTLVPEQYRQNVPNVLIALEIAGRLGASPMLIMQNLHVIGGRPSWSASFLVATVNQCGRFTPLRYETRGDDPRDPSFKCRAYAEDKASGERCEGEWIDWPMVDGEGWSKKSGSKWRTMPGQMFRYRAAAFWTRVFAPEVSMGITTDDEAADIAPEREPVKVMQQESAGGMTGLRARLGMAEKAPSSPQEPREPETAPDGGAEQERPAAVKQDVPAGKVECPGCGNVLPAGEVDVPNKCCIDCAGK